MRERLERHVDSPEHLAHLGELLAVWVRLSPDRTFDEVEHPQDSRPAVVRLDDHVVASVDGQPHPLDGQLRSGAFEKAHRGGLQPDNRLCLIGW